MGSSTFSLSDLATSTRAAFDVLEPWYNKTHSSATLQQLTSQANGYVDALGESVKAARCGYIVACQGVRIIDSLSKDGSAYSKDDIVAYVKEMVTIAQEGLQHAEGVVVVFRRVRKELMQLTEDARAEKNSDSTEAELKLLEDGIEVLGKFEASVSMYIAWWIASVLDAECIKCDAPSTESSMLKRTTIRAAWMELQVSYSEYTEKISEVQDLHQFLMNEEKAIDEKVSMPGNLV